MFENMLKLKGVQQLTKDDQVKVNGANGGCFACFCHFTNTNPNCCCVN